MFIESHYGVLDLSLDVKPICPTDVPVNTQWHAKLLDILIFIKFFYKILRLEQKVRTLLFVLDILYLIIEKIELLSQIS